MKYAHKVLIAFCIVASALIIGLYWLAAVKDAQRTPVVLSDVVMTGQMMLYYGETCPHCKIVEEWLDMHDAAGVLGVERKEVYYNNANAEALGVAAQACGLQDDSIGVPFLVVDSQCYVGDEPIVDYLSERLEGAK